MPTMASFRATWPTADDAHGGPPDDEDGVLNPLDLQATVGAQPRVTLLATNNTGSEATLYGWIDYNQDGVFDNTSERAQLAIPDGTNGQRFTLTFPTIPDGSVGTTYVRLRLSTDAASSDPTGPAIDGEVEDYQFNVIQSGTPYVTDYRKISGNEGGFPDVLKAGSKLGSSVASIGDLDGDGVNDLAVGARRHYDDSNPSTGPGAVWILFMNRDGTVRDNQKISNTAGGMEGQIDEGDLFGWSVASLGDLNGDGNSDIAVGAIYDRSIVCIQEPYGFFF